MLEVEKVHWTSALAEHSSTDRIRGTVNDVSTGQVARYHTKITEQHHDGQWSGNAMFFFFGINPSGHETKT